MINQKYKNNIIKNCNLYDRIPYRYNSKIFFLMYIRKINKFYAVVKEHIKKVYYLHLIYTFSIIISENGTILQCNF
jgi:hypothetical protein